MTSTDHGLTVEEIPRSRPAPLAAARPDLLAIPPEDGGPPLDDPDVGDLGDGVYASWAEDFGFTSLRLETDVATIDLTRPQVDELRRFAARHWPAPADTAQLTLGGGEDR